MVTYSRFSGRIDSLLPMNIDGEFLVERTRLDLGIVE